MSSNDKSDWLELQRLLQTAKSEEDFRKCDRLETQLRGGDYTAGHKWAARTLAEVAEFFGLSIQTVKQWRMESPPMPGGDGSYPLNEIVAWRHAKLVQSDLKSAKQQQEFELGQIKLEREKLDLAREQKKIVDVADVERWAATALIETREMMMQLPQMVGQSAPAELRPVAIAESERCVRDALTALRRRLEGEIETE